MSVPLVLRSLHLLAMGALVGGSVLCAWACLRRHPYAPALARAYEAIFWGAVGVSVATGVGNLGGYGRALPLADTPWGFAFGAKLALVLVGLPLSALRTLVAAFPTPSGEAPRALSALHLLTAAGLLVAVVLAEAMAHGA